MLRLKDELGEDDLVSAFVDLADDEKVRLSGGSLMLTRNLHMAAIQSYHTVKGRRFLVQDVELFDTFNVRCNPRLIFYYF